MFAQVRKMPKDFTRETALVISKTGDVWFFRRIRRKRKRLWIWTWVKVSTFHSTSCHSTSFHSLSHGCRCLLFPRAQNFPSTLSSGHGGLGRGSSFSLFGPPFDVGEWWHGVSHNLFFGPELLHLGPDYDFAHGLGEHAVSV